MTQKITIYTNSNPENFRTWDKIDAFSWCLKRDIHFTKRGIKGVKKNTPSNIKKYIHKLILNCEKKIFK